MKAVKKVVKALFFVPLAIVAGLIDNGGNFILMGKDSRRDDHDDAYQRIEGIR